MGTNQGERIWKMATSSGVSRLQKSMGRRRDHTDECRKRIEDELKARAAVSRLAPWQPQGQDAMDVDEGEAGHDPS